MQMLAAVLPIICCHTSNNEGNGLRLCSVHPNDFGSQILVAIMRLQPPRLCQSYLFFVILSESPQLILFNSYHIFRRTDNVIHTIANYLGCR